MAEGKLTKENLKKSYKNAYDKVKGMTRDDVKFLNTQRSIMNDALAHIFGCDADEDLVTIYVEMMIYGMVVMSVREPELDEERMYAALDKMASLIENKHDIEG